MALRQKIAIAGAGLAGATIARVLADSGDYLIDVFDGRDHVAGNCHTKRDDDTGVLVHEYGPHIFHTDSRVVWNFMNRFSAFNGYTNRVKANTSEGMFSLPINLLTINQLFQSKFNPKEAQEFIRSIAIKSEIAPRNFEEQALQMVGELIYETFFKHYTIKQWGVRPNELPASILKRLPLRFDYNDNYFFHKYQGIPTEGYTPLVSKMLAHPKIRVNLKTHFPRSECSQYDHTFYSGPIDGFFDHRFGRLGYRTLDFQRISGEGHSQGNAVINYCDEKTPHTRITEHNYFAPEENHQSKVLMKEFSRDCGLADIPYYPLRLERDKELLLKYQANASKLANISFIGRLGTYQYLDMDRVVLESMTTAKQYISERSQNIKENPITSNAVSGSRVFFDPQEVA